MSKFLIYAENNQLRNLKLNGHGLVPVEEVPVLPGYKKRCLEVIWRNPLDNISKERPYTLGEVDVKKRLRQHAFYSTYQALDPRLDRHVILKAIPPQHTIPYLRKESEKQAIFEAIRSIGRLSHPNIATLFDMGEHDSIIYFSREYIEGTPVDQFEFPAEDLDFEFAAVLLKTVQALKHASEHNVRHLNLKPENLWILDGQGLKITDFQIRGFNFAETAEHPLPEQWRYLAPEFLIEKKGDSRSDIYSIGMIMLRVLSGAPPFTHLEHPSELLQSKTELPDSPLWEPILQKATAIKPGNRYQTLAEFEVDLRKIQVELLSNKLT